MIDILLSIIVVAAVIYGVAKFAVWANNLAEDYERED